jgi:hypothetical protein
LISGALFLGSLQNLIGLCSVAARLLKVQPRTAVVSSFHPDRQSSEKQYK